MEWIVYLVNDEDEASTFYCDIAFRRSHIFRRSNIISWRSVCTNAPADDTFIDKKKCLQINLNHIKKNCGGVGDIHVIVIISYDPGFYAYNCDERSISDIITSDIQPESEQCQCKYCFEKRQELFHNVTPISSIIKTYNFYRTTPKV